MALPSLAAPALLGLERLENLCPCDLSPNGPHLHFSCPPRAAGQRDPDLGLPCYPSFPRTPGTSAGFTAEASSTVSTWSKSPQWCK